MAEHHSQRDSSHCLCVWLTGALKRALRPLGGSQTPCKAEFLHCWHNAHLPGSSRATAASSEHHQDTAVPRSTHPEHPQPLCKTCARASPPIQSIHSSSAKPVPGPHGQEFLSNIKSKSAILHLKAFPPCAILPGTRDKSSLLPAHLGSAIPHGGRNKTLPCIFLQQQLATNCSANYCTPELLHLLVPKPSPQHCQHLCNPSAPGKQELAREWWSQSWEGLWEAPAVLQSCFPPVGSTRKWGESEFC